MRELTNLGFFLTIYTLSAGKISRAVALDLASNVRSYQYSESETDVVERAMNMLYEGKTAEDLAGTGEAIQSTYGRDLRMKAIFEDNETGEEMLRMMSRFRVMYQMANELNTAFLARALLGPVGTVRGLNE